MANGQSSFPRFLIFLWFLSLPSGCVCVCARLKGLYCVHNLIKSRRVVNVDLFLIIARVQNVGVFALLSNFPFLLFSYHSKFIISRLFMPKQTNCAASEFAGVVKVSSLVILLLLCSTCLSKAKTNICLRKSF